MRLLILLLGLFLLNTGYAQVAEEEKMNYQAVIYDTNGRIVVNGSVGMKISLLKDSEMGSAVYVETHTGMTNENGLLTLEIGGGTQVSGDYSIIDWSTGAYFLKTEADPAGGTNYSITGVTKLMSVPFALYAQKANETDPVYGNSVAASITSADTAAWNAKQNALIAGTGVAISGDTIRNSLIAGAGLAISGDTLSVKNKHYVGEHFGGGIVAYVWPDGEHGLIIAYEDIDKDEKFAWSSVTTTKILGNTMTDGLSNTLGIINQPGHTWSAANECYKWTNEDYANTGVFDDWYLPSYNEMLLIKFNVALIYDALELDGLSETYYLTHNDFYWSSTQVVTDGIDGPLGDERAYRFKHRLEYFYEGTSDVSYGLKANNNKVRCVRRF